ncbi:MAG: tetratricopeptide repeat protein, partial [Frankiaceae bacterium]|nr:tetratricopeptide repeat protein [Frankiaceae bacterium]
MQPRTPAPSGPAISSAALAGAVDLAAVKARSEAAARAAEAPAPGAFVVEVTEETFQAEVLDRSFQVPVLIDLWAEWCQPCKQLSPVLERLARAGGGAWVLAKVDVDANPHIQQALQVQSIPTIFAVIAGQLVPGFAGALPEPQVREFLDAVLGAAARAGLSGPPAPAGDAGEAGGAVAAQPAEPADPRLDAAEQALEDGDYDEAIRRYEAILAAEPNHPYAAPALPRAQLIRRVSALSAEVVVSADAAPDDFEAQLRAADWELAYGDDVGAALRRLIAAVRRSGGSERAALRERLVQYFDLLGPEDPAV